MPHQGHNTPNFTAPLVISASLHHRLDNISLFFSFTCCVEVIGTSVPSADLLEPRENTEFLVTVGDTK